MSLITILQYSMATSNVNICSPTFYNYCIASLWHQRRITICREKNTYLFTTLKLLPENQDKKHYRQRCHETPHRAHRANRNTAQRTPRAPLRAPCTDTSHHAALWSLAYGEPLPVPWRPWGIAVYRRRLKKNTDMLVFAGIGMDLYKSHVIYRLLNFVVSASV